MFLPISRSLPRNSADPLPLFDRRESKTRRKFVDFLISVCFDKNAKKTIFFLGVLWREKTFAQQRNAVRSRSPNNRLSFVRENDSSRLSLKSFEREKVDSMRFFISCAIAIVVLLDRIKRLIKSTFSSCETCYSIFPIKLSSLVAPVDIRREKQKMFETFQFDQFTFSSDCPYSNSLINYVKRLGGAIEPEFLSRCRFADKTILGRFNEIKTTPFVFQTPQSEFLDQETLYLDLAATDAAYFSDLWQFRTYNQWHETSEQWNSMNAINEDLIIYS